MCCNWVFSHAFDSWVFFLHCILINTSKSALSAIIAFGTVCHCFVFILLEIVFLIDCLTGYEAWTFFIKNVPCDKWGLITVSFQFHDYGGAQKNVQIIQVWPLSTIIIGTAAATFQYLYRVCEFMLNHRCGFQNTCSF